MEKPTENAPFFVDREVIVLTRNGTWVADGIEVSHEATRRLFAKNLKKDREGYFIQVGRETKRIQVEDTAYFVHRIDGNPEIGYQVWLNDETREKLDPKTLLYSPGRLICRVKSGQEEAKFLHSAYFDFLHPLKEDEKSYYLEFGKAPNLLKVKLSGK